jgi:hypothetical protein
MDLLIACKPNLLRNASSLWFVSRSTTLIPARMECNSQYKEKQCQEGEVGEYRRL